MKRVLQIVGKMNIGGAEQLLMNVYRNIDRSKVQFDFLTFYEPGEMGFYDEEIRSLGGAVVNIRKPSAAHPWRSVADVRAVLRERDYDAIHTHIGGNGAYALYAAAKENVPIRVAHAHNTKSNSRLRDIYASVIKPFNNHNLTKCCACSTAAAEYYFGKNNLENDYIYIPNAFDTGPFLREYDRDKIRGELNLADSAYVIIHVGNLKAQKNQLYITELAEKYCKANPNARFLLVGRDEGAYAESVKAKVKEYDLGEYVIFLGQRTDVAELMAASDVMIMPSVFEGLGIVLIEAQASGLPCVVSQAIQPEADLGGGLMKKLSLDNVASWVETLDNCRDLPRPNPEQRRELIENSMFDLGKTIRCFEMLYEI